MLTGFGHRLAYVGPVYQPNSPWSCLRRRLFHESNSHPATWRSPDPASVNSRRRIFADQRRPVLDRAPGHGNRTRAADRRHGIDRERAPCGFARRARGRRAADHRTKPRLSSLTKTRWAAGSGRRFPAPISMSGVSGGSYGSSMPVNPSMRPALAFAWSPLRSRASQVSRGTRRRPRRIRRPLRWSREARAGWPRMARWGADRDSAVSRDLGRYEADAAQVDFPVLPGETGLAREVLAHEIPVEEHYAPRSRLFASRDRRRASSCSASPGYPFLSVPPCGSLKAPILESSVSRRSCQEPGVRRGGSFRAAAASRNACIYVPAEAGTVAILLAAGGCSGVTGPCAGGGAAAPPCRSSAWSSDRCRSRSARCRRHGTSTGPRRGGPSRGGR